jgi:long-chain acyl-CoA synthetase
MEQVGSHPRGVADIAASAPDRVALVDGYRRMTYGELDQRANGLANELAERGIGAGDAVGVMLRNRAEWFCVSHAIARLGAMCVPISVRMTRREVEFIVGDSQMKVLFTEVLSGVEIGEVDAIDVESSAFERIAPAPPLPDFIHVLPSLMSYTSGTTGRPKAVERPTPRPVQATTTSPIAAYLGYGPTTVQLVCGPCCHTGPSTYAEFALCEGGKVIVQDGFIGERCLSLIEEQQVNRAFMVPAHFIRLLDADWRRYDRSSVRMILHSAAPCPPALKWRTMEIFPPGTIWELYGATEGMGTVISPGDWLMKPGSVGRPFPGLKVRILDDKGASVDNGEVGGIYVSPMGGYEFSYRGDPEKTAAAHRDGFFTAGDMGWLDDDGFLFIADRRTDLIVSGGVNIYPAEIEAVLAEDPDIADSTVIGLPDERMGQRVHALVVIRSGAIADESRIIERLSERLAPFKRPRTIEILDEIPRDLSGKVRKRELVDERELLFSIRPEHIDTKELS